MLKVKKKKKKTHTHTHTHTFHLKSFLGKMVRTRYKPPIIRMYGRKRKKKTAQPVALWMEPISYWA